MRYKRDMDNTNAIPPRETLLATLKADMVCAGCKGTGRRGRGQCRACNGSGETDLCASPRVKFNSGFHDACVELLEFKRPRNPEGMYLWYRLGYIAGLDVASKTGEHPRWSSAAWMSTTGLDDDLRPVTLHLLK